MKTIRDLADSLSGKKVLMRVDFNVPRDPETHEITNDLRIRRALPTIRFALENGAAVILMSHLGRPKGKRKEEDSLRPVAARLGELLGKEVAFAEDCVGPQAKEAAQALQPGQVLMLENTRFHAEEEENDPAFAKDLASLGDVFVSDAFGTVHRAHASTAGVADYLPSAAGLLVAKEVEYLGKAISDPPHPYVAVMGGAKVSDKIGVIRNLLPRVDAMLIGGAMAYTFLKQQGIGVGNSKVEDDRLETAAELLAEAGLRGRDSRGLDRPGHRAEDDRDVPPENRSGRPGHLERSARLRGNRPVRPGHGRGGPGPGGLRRRHHRRRRGDGRSH